jgi:hypothetical protein
VGPCNLYVSISLQVIILVPTPGRSRDGPWEALGLSKSYKSLQFTRHFASHKTKSSWDRDMENHTRDSMAEPEVAFIYSFPLSKCGLNIYWRPHEEIATEVMHTHTHTDYFLWGPYSSEAGGVGSAWGGGVWGGFLEEDLAWVLQAECGFTVYGKAFLPGALHKQSRALWGLERARSIWGMSHMWGLMEKGLGR